MPGPLVSIALCTYNGEKYLEQQLDTLLEQTYPDIEVIAVDDRSHDGTYLILASYAAKYPHIKVFQNHQNLGYVKNFEQAIGLCTGEFIALCDQDDLWHPDKIALQVAAMDGNILVYHDSEFVDEGGKPMGKHLSDIMNFYRGGRPEAFLLFNCISGHSMLGRRGLFEKAIPFKKDFYHDWWIAYVAANMGTVDFIPQGLVQYRQHNSSNTNILKIDRSKADPFSALGVDEGVRKQTAWLSYCAGFRFNKYPEFVDEFCSLFKKRLNGRYAPQLVVFMARHVDLLFSIQKKSKWSKLNFIRKMLKGLKY